MKVDENTVVREARGTYDWHNRRMTCEVPGCGWCEENEDREVALMKFVAHVKLTHKR